MTYERFREIMNEEGITSDTLIHEIWTGRPYDDLEEDRIRATTQWTVKQDEYKAYCVINDMLEKETGPGKSNYRTPPGGEGS